MLSCLYSPILAITARRRRMRKNALSAVAMIKHPIPNKAFRKKLESSLIK